MDKKKISDLTVGLNVGITIHLISISKKYDLFQGNTQIGIIDNNGFEEKFFSTLTQNIIIPRLKKWSNF
jgi:hypothetical protein